METTGILKSVTRDWQSDKIIVSFEIDTIPGDLEKLTDCNLDIKAVKHYDHRSPNANRYFHKLVDLLSVALGESNTSVKNRLIRDYGAFLYIDGQIPTSKIKAEYEDDLLLMENVHVKVIGRMIEDGEEWVRFAYMRGSHTYNIAEMARLIDGTVEEAKGQGIETLTPEELERMKCKWNTKGS